MSLRHGLSAVTRKSPSDVVIITALRTAIARSGKGSFKDSYPEELLSHVLDASRQRLEGMSVRAGQVQDIAVGTVLMELGGAKSGRLAALHAGYPYQTTFRTVNRQCSSSLQALTDIAATIDSGAIDCGIAAGTESMTRNYGSRAIPTDLSPSLRESPVQDARDCLLPMGLTSEAVAEKYGIARTALDEFSLSSHLKASAAEQDGLFADEIVPIEVNYVTEDGSTVKKTVSKDEGIRHGLTLEKLNGLKPAFKPDGRSTAGNSSQISDGASAVTLMRRSMAEQLGLKPLAKFVGSNVVGVPPRIMGVGPAFSTPVLLKRFGLEVGDIDLFELNEAFASQALMTIGHLNLDITKVNPKGGAIAIGHPLGATGGRLVSSLIHELRRTEKKIGVAALCCGTGFGKSSLFVAE
ncbi:acetyl-CoA acyltransferase [Puccinia graminis f. sp. tritici CRL 75-36-700-3]|uniref:acetyl-CoA C-acyltransferase n=1 Tax=Puccinia graminis f. sp. tritici (strain CRL 75-36-700-3 / race SCCL) TaxID=418459 RepID=E3KHL4_PUCGT|nr:acetyl-CoA acyltransferase [Puccinia graminis f. sp. tritici CRL 75-36-700-3]EFP83789.1 acetyl-CoA acyltransferase [Puccinia graminis f. sp. tritici CRL 75-36-700-3]